MNGCARVRDRQRTYARQSSRRWAYMAQKVTRIHIHTPQYIQANKQTLSISLCSQENHETRENQGRIAPLISDISYVCTIYCWQTVLGPGNFGCITAWSDQFVATKRSEVVLDLPIKSRTELLHKRFTEHDTHQWDKEKIGWPGIKLHFLNRLSNDMGFRTDAMGQIRRTCTHAYIRIKRQVGQTAGYFWTSVESLIELTLHTKHDPSNPIYIDKQETMEQPDYSTQHLSQVEYKQRVRRSSN